MVWPHDSDLVGHQFLQSQWLFSRINDSDIKRQGGTQAEEVTMDHMAATRVQWPAPRHFSSPHPSYYSVFFIPFSTFSRAITFLEFQDPDSPCHLRLTLSVLMVGMFPTPCHYWVNFPSVLSGRHLCRGQRKGSLWDWHRFWGANSCLQL